MSTHAPTLTLYYNKDKKRAVKGVSMICTGVCWPFLLNIHDFWLVGEWTSYPCKQIESGEKKAILQLTFMGPIGETEKSVEGQLKRQNGQHNLWV